MLYHLESLYGDPDRKRKAEDECDKLHLMDSESYGKRNDLVSFLRLRNAFTCLAVELNQPRDSCKASFERRISPVLQKSLALQFLDDSIQFDVISKLAQKVDYTNTTADASLRARREANKPSGKAIILIDILTPKIIEYSLDPHSPFLYQILVHQVENNSLKRLEKAYA